MKKIYLRRVVCAAKYFSWLDVVSSFIIDTMFLARLIIAPISWRRNSSQIWNCKKSDEGGGEGEEDIQRLFSNFFHMKYSAYSLLFSFLRYPLDKSSYTCRGMDITGILRAYVYNILRLSSRCVVCFSRRHIRIRGAKHWTKIRTFSISVVFYLLRWCPWN